MDALPEIFVSDDGARIAAPTYQALATLQMVMQSAETGATGPTMVEEGEIFTTDAVPGHMWKPLNRAAGDRVQQWLASLPLDGRTIPQDFITQAAYELRPREGDPDFPLEQWWPAVLRRASELAEKRRGPNVGNTAYAHRPGGTPVPVMPFVTAGPGQPMEVGRAPADVAQHQPQSPGAAATRARKAAVAPPMPGTQPARSPQQAAG